MSEAEDQSVEFVKSALASHPNSKIAVIKMVREECGLGLKEAKELVDRVDAEIKGQDPNFGYEGRKKGCLGLMILFVCPVTYLLMDFI
jgi:hypothetical protein